MKPITNGKLLSAEQSVRLTVVDCVERKLLIEYIAASMREMERTKGKRLQGYRRSRLEAR